MMPAWGDKSVWTINLHQGPCRILHRSTDRPHSRNHPATHDFRTTSVLCFLANGIHLFLPPWFLFPVVGWGIGAYCVRGHGLVHACILIGPPPLIDLFNSPPQLIPTTQPTTSHSPKPALSIHGVITYFIVDKLGGSWSQLSDEYVWRDGWTCAVHTVEWVECVKKCPLTHPVKSEYSPRQTLAHHVQVCLAAHSRAHQGQGEGGAGQIRG